MDNRDGLLKQTFINSEYVGQYAELRGCRLHYYAIGRGEPVLLLHGAGQSLFTWNKLIEGLSRTHCVYAIDLPGGGYTKVLESAAYDIESTARLLYSFIETLGLSCVHICAFSTGAYPALAFAEEYPYAVARLALISPGMLTKAMPLPLRLMRHGMGPIAWTMLSDKNVRAYLESGFFDRTRVTDAMVRQYAEPYADKATRRALSQALRSMDTSSVDDRMGAIICDTLLLWGKEDKLRPSDTASLIRTRFRSVDAQLIANCGHIVQEEKPDKLLLLLSDFLKHGMRRHIAG